MHSTPKRFETVSLRLPSSHTQGRSQDFSKGGSHGPKTRFLTMIFMSFLPPVVGCLLKTWFTKEGGGGHGHPKTPLATPLPTLMRYENGPFRKRSSNQRKLKTPDLRFSVESKRCESGAGTA